MSLYDDLGLSGSRSSTEEIKKAYRIKAKQYHPDRDGGNEEKFKKVVEAYKILSDPDSKSKYDMFGEDWIRNRNGLSSSNARAGGSSGDDDFEEDPIMNMISGLFGHYFRHTGGRPPPPQHNARVQIEKSFDATLEEIYMCNKKAIKINKPVVCKSCHGAGVKEIKVCPECCGKQYSYIPKYLVISLDPEIDLSIPIEVRGVLDTDSILRIRILERKHEKYHRSVEQGQDLCTSMNIPLHHALGKLKQTLHHLDNEDYILVYHDIIKPGQRLRAKNMGLLKKNGKRGDLFIDFTVEFPTSISKLSLGDEEDPCLQEKTKVILLEKIEF
jgi:DnaJ-class molecular chaperone